MASSELLIDKLRMYCKTKPGVDKNMNIYGPDKPTYQLIGGNSYVTSYMEAQSPYLLLRCHNARLQELQVTYPGIRIDETMKCDTITWAWVDVLLDGSIPEAIVIQLIDDSYTMVYNELSDAEKQSVAFLSENLSIVDSLPRLIALHSLSHRSDEIKKLVKSAILLKTQAVDEERIAIGQSKIGGLPDLPESWSWPIVEGMPLAFLAQINLDEIPVALHQDRLPEKGVLYFFSIFGWHLADGDLPPDIPWDRSFSEPGWSRVFYYKGDLSALKRTVKPAEVSIEIFHSAQVSYEAVPSLPSSHKFTRDPGIGVLGWTEEEYERFDDLCSDFDRNLRKSLDFSALHQLLGYAASMQSVVVPTGMMLLFQLDSDNEINAMWGDGGIIYFMIAENDLAGHNFSKVKADFQSG